MGAVESARRLDSESALKVGSLKRAIREADQIEPTDQWDCDVSIRQDRQWLNVIQNSMVVAADGYTKETNKVLKLKKAVPFANIVKI